MHAHSQTIPGMYIFCLIWFNCTAYAVFTYQTKSSFLYYLTCIQNQSLLQAQGPKESYCRKLSYNLFPVHVQTTCTNVNTEHPSQRLHNITPPLAPLSKDQRTQDTLCTDEPSPSTPLFSTRRQLTQRETGYTCMPLLSVLGISWPTHNPVSILQIEVAFDRYSLLQFDMPLA